MTDLPATWSVPVVRADFSDNDVWQRLKKEIADPTEDGFGADASSWRTQRWTDWTRRRSPPLSACLP